MTCNYFIVCVRLRPLCVLGAADWAISLTLAETELLLPLSPCLAGCSLHLTRHSSSSALLDDLIRTTNHIIGTGVHIVRVVGRVRPAAPERERLNECVLLCGISS